jgi:hypothetical protein
MIRPTEFSSVASRVEAGSNTSTVTLRVVGGGEKGSLKSETVKYGRKSQGTRTRKKTVLARASSIYKRQTRPLVREGTPQKQDRNCQIVIYIWSWAPDGVWHQDLLTDWLTDRQSQCDFNFNSSVSECSAVQYSEAKWSELVSSQLVREMLQLGRCELLLLEAGSWGTGSVREPRGRGDVRR